MKFTKGERFGCLTVIGAAPPLLGRGPYKRSRVAVLCDCGRRFAYLPENLSPARKHCKACAPLATGGPNQFMAGELHRKAKLTQAAVREIRESALSGNELAQKLGVSKSTVSNVRRGKTWTRDSVNVGGA